MENKKIINSEYIFLDIDINDQKSAFEFISKKAKELNITDDVESLVKGFQKREAEGTTGFEDGFAIPHARISEVKQAAVMVMRFKKSIDWDSMDGKPTEVAIALMIPDGPNGEEHLAILSDIAVKLMDEDFKKILKTSNSKEEILNLLKNKKNINEVKEASIEDEKILNNKFNILAITACVTGVAHTYMAEEKLLKEVPKMGYNIKVETHGSKGVGTPFSDQDIADADLIVFATDINVDNSRFEGKKFYQTKVARAIKDPQGLINEAIEKGKIIPKNTGEFDTNKSKSSKGKDQSVLRHIMAGISYMIPAIILGGICLAFSIGIAKIVWGPEAGPAGPNNEYEWGILNVLNIIGGAAFMLMIPILAGFIANSIAGRAAIAPAMVGALIGNTNTDFMPICGIAIDTPTGFIGALIAGLLVGYFVRWVNTWKVPKSLQAAMPIFFIPLVAGIGISLLFIYVIGGPIGWVMHQISWGIQKAYEGNVGIGVGLALGLLLGAMAGFDMGGPINKIAFITCSMLVTQQIYEPMGAMAAAIPVAPLGMGISTVLFRQFFNKDEQGLGIAAIIMGCIGISEGAIPFAIRDPRRAVISNVIGSAVAGAIAGAFGVSDYAAHGGPIVAILGAVPYGLDTLWFFLAIIVGVTITVSIYGSWMLYEAGAPGSVKERHVAYLNTLRADKKDNLEKLNDELKNIKSEWKEKIKIAKNKNESKDQIDLLINGKNLEIKQNKIKQNNVKEEFKTLVTKADITFKELQDPEKITVKSESKELKDFSSKVNEQRNIEIKTLKNELKEIKEDKELSKFEKNSKSKELKEEIESIKSKALEKSKEKQIDVRKEFVISYEKQLGLANLR